MPSLKRYLITFIVFCHFAGIYGQEDYQLCTAPSDAFSPGERLEYSLYYNWNFIWIPAGTLDFYISENEKSFLIEVTGKTLESYDWFYKVDDHYQCVMDKNEFRPLYYKRDIHEGNYKIYNEISFDYEKDSLYSTVILNEGSPDHYVYPIADCVLDLLSLCYKLRNLDIASLRAQEQIEIDLIFDEKIFNIPIKYLGEEKSKRIFGLGRFNLHKISPDLIAGHVFKEGQKMVIWVSQDENRIPVLIESPIKVGSIKAILRNYSNLRYPFEMENEQEDK